MVKKNYYIYLSSHDSEKTGLNTLGYWSGKTMTFEKDYKVPYCTPDLDKNTKSFNSSSEAIQYLYDAVSENNYTAEILGTYRIVSVTTLSFRKDTVEIKISTKSKPMPGRWE